VALVAVADALPDAVETTARSTIDDTTTSAHDSDPRQR